MTTLRSSHTGLFKPLITYMSGALFSRGLQFILLPLWIKLLTPSEYGLLELLTNFQMILGALTSVGLMGTVLSTIYFNCTSPQEEQQTIGDIVAAHTLIALPILLILGVNYQFLNRSIFYSYASGPIITTMLLTCYLSFYNEASHMLLSLKKKALLATFFHISTQFIALPLTFLFVVSYKKGCSGIIYAQLIAHALTAGVKVLYVSHHYSPRLPTSITASFQRIKSYLSISLPFLAYMFSVMLFNNVDRWILASYLGLHQTGIFSFAAKFGLLFQQCITAPFFMAYIPHLYAQYQQTPTAIIFIEKNRQKKTLVLLGIGIAVITAGYYIGLPIATYFLPPCYAAALPLTYYMVVEKLLLSSCHFTMLFTLYKKRAALFTGILFSANALNCCLDLLVVKRYGIYGCVYATVFTNSLALIACLIASKREYQNLVIPAQSSPQDRPHIPYQRLPVATQQGFAKQTTHRP